MRVDHCPQCGAPAEASQRDCVYCKSPFFVTRLSHVGSLEASALRKYIDHYRSLLSSDPSDPDSNLGLALCYLSSKLYPLAEQYCQKALDVRPDLADVYYYFALCKLAGRRPGRLDRRTIQFVEALLETAIQIDPYLGHYDLLLAGIRYDYYRSNGLRIPSPSDQDLLAGLPSKHLEPSELEKMISLVSLPEAFIGQLLRL